MVLTYRVKVYNCCNKNNLNALNFRPYGKLHFRNHNATFLRNQSMKTSLKVHKDPYYELGLKPTATQEDIKAAYYELSKIYHPDKSKGSIQDHKKFRDITEAYEALKMTRFKKEYDQFAAVIEKEELEDPLERFFKARENKSKLQEYCGNMKLNDFELWTRRNYSKSLQRDIGIKRKLKFSKEMNKKEAQTDRTIKTIFSLATVVIICYFIVE